jgi:hypothetical protein
MRRSRRENHYWNIAKRDGGQLCAWCSKKLTLGIEQYSFDHVRSANDGGSWWIGNLILACPPCNSSRNHTDALTYMKLCLREKKPVRQDVIYRALRRQADPRADRHLVSYYTDLIYKTMRDPYYLGLDAEQLLDPLLDAT